MAYYQENCEDDEEEVDCDDCVSRFARAGGCECWMDDECDEMMYVPDGCDVCGDAAAEFCGIPTDEDKCAELEAKYPECDDEYEGEMHCEPSDEDMAYYQENCEDDEEEVDCDDCVSRFARAGGCECWMDDECDEMMYVPDGCDVC